MTRIAKIALLGGLMIAPFATTAANAQPCVGNRNMCDALNALQQARASLQRADSNKGGHRAQALRSVDQAIQQVRNGIRYSNNDPIYPGRPDRPGRPR
jgi:glycine/serine hydroxymethyltransferase